jgi:hypothetical protein
VIGTARRAIDGFSRVRDRWQAVSEVGSQIEAIEDACLDVCVPLGGIRIRSEVIDEAVERGYQLLRVGGDLDAIETTIGDRLDEIHEDD